MMLLKKKEWPPANIDILQKILADFDCYGPLFPKYQECYTCGKDVDTGPGFSGGIIIDRFLTLTKPLGSCRVLCDYCWWEADLNPRLREQIIGYDSMMVKMREKRVQREAEEEEQRKKRRDGGIIYNAEKVFNKHVRRRRNLELPSLQ